MSARMVVPARMAAIGCALAATSLVAVLVPAASAVTPSATRFRPGPAQILPGGLSVGSVSRVNYLNWAGYASHGHTFSVVRATWKQPKVTCTGVDAIAAFWLGLDGYKSQTVEQAGTLAYCHNGRPTYYTWWEMYPRNNIQTVHASVRPGDKITSSVVRKGTSYTLKVVDHTHPANSFTRHTRCAACKDSSAEWVAERVAGKSGYVPLAKFRKVAFTDSMVGVGSAHGDIGRYAHDAITMVNASGTKLASVSSLKKGGKKFVATWHHSR